MNTEIKTGYLYHIKDEYFDVVNDDNLIMLEKFIKLIDLDNEFFYNSKESIDKTKKLVLQLMKKRMSHRMIFMDFIDK